jgi:hypothetical protein
MRMTNQQFNEAFRAVQQGTLPPDDELGIRVLCASALILKHRRGLGPEEEWTPDPADLAEFLDGLDYTRRRRLKRIAEGLLGVRAEAIH